MLTFGIQIMKSGEAFNTRFLPIMWDENIGPVEVDPYGPGGGFTVYASGPQAMAVMSQISGYGTRLVYLSSSLNPYNNGFYKTTRRTAGIEYQIRDALTASERGAPNLFWDFQIGSFGEFDFGETKANSKISKSNAKYLRENFGLTEGIYELIQQTYTTE